MTSFLIKRILDLTISLFLLFCSLPIIIFFSFLILLIERQMPIFKQKRSGKNGRIIYIYKLTSMKINPLNHNEKYVTRIGNFCRITKIDELPQLLNVIEGSLSLVGPRPLYLEFNRYLSKRHKKRLLMKPGITGLAQVKMRDSTNWIKKFNLDVYYIDNYSIKLDFYIIFMTIIMIIKLILKKEKKIVESSDYIKNFFENYKK